MEITTDGFYINTGKSCEFYALYKTSKFFIDTGDFYVLKYNLSIRNYVN